MQTFKKRKTVRHDLQSFGTFAEKQRAVELEALKKVQKHGLCQPGRVKQPLPEDLRSDPLRHPTKSTSGISSAVSQNPKKNTKEDLQKQRTSSQRTKNQQYHIPPRIVSTFRFDSRRTEDPQIPRRVIQEKKKWGKKHCCQTAGEGDQVERGVIL